MLIHVCLLIRSARVHTPVVDEVGHLAAGLSHWHLHRLDLYCVNPPLVRAVATLPAAISGEPIDFTGYRAHPRYRPEFLLGMRWMNEHPDRILPMFTLARWACVPFSVLGAVVCFLWARDLYGSSGGLVSLCLWCFSPTIIGHASLLTPDTGAAATGAAACYAFMRWMNSPGLHRALTAGVFLGLALLTKFTWMILPGICSFWWLVLPWVHRNRRAYADGSHHGSTSSAHRIASAAVFRPHRSGVASLFLILLTGWCVLNNGYLWEDTFCRLGDFDFSSTSLGGREAHLHSDSGGNRFRGTVMENIPVPVPRNYLQGIDHIKFEYEAGKLSYLRGEKKHGGWWYYYLYAMLIKIPAGTLTLVAISGVLFLRQTFCAPAGSTGGSPPTLLIHELYLLCPAIAVIWLVSAQTGFNHHLRYVLPAFPFLFIFGGRTAELFRSARFFRRALPVLLLAASMLSSLSNYPHGLSYFNELIGGSANGWQHLDYSNVDWGQDLLLVKEWVNDHPDATPLYISSVGYLNPDLLGIPSEPLGWPGKSSEPGAVGQIRPGWYIVSLTRLVDPHEPIHVLIGEEPVDRIGYSMHVFHIAPP
ncbi:MAG: glycosyltransferase family 39 protein [Fuerstiella sp.]